MASVTIGTKAASSPSPAMVDVAHFCRSGRKRSAIEQHDDRAGEDDLGRERVVVDRRRLPGRELGEQDHERSSVRPGAPSVTAGLMTLNRMFG